MADSAFIAKQEEGPVVILTVLPDGPASMGPLLGKWFGFTVAFVAFVAFVAYGLGSWPQSIWSGRKWITTLKHTFDGLIYALLTAGAFGWLWP